MPVPQLKQINKPKQERTLAKDQSRDSLVMSVPDPANLVLSPKERESGNKEQLQSYSHHPSQ